MAAHGSGHPAVTMCGLLFLSCGGRDGLIRISQALHSYLKEKGIEHIWHADDSGHAPKHWKNSLYHFLQRISR